MKTRVLIAVIAATLILPLTGCNSTDSQKQASQGTHKMGAEAVYGSLTSTRIKSN